MKLQSIQKMRKGQVELVVVVGIIIVAAIFVILNVQYHAPESPTVPEDVQQEKKLVEDFISNMIKDSVTNSLKIVEAHGGYLNPLFFEGGGTVIPHTIFLNDGVPYWQECSGLSIPDRSLVSRMIKIATEQYIKDNIGGVRFILGKDVDYDLESLDVTVNVLENKIIVQTALPIILGGYSFSNPYPVVEMPTNLGRIYNFARDFSIESANKRFFEAFLLHSLYFSKYLPTSGVLTDCGTSDDIHLSGEEVDSIFKDLIKASIRPALWTPMVSQGPGSGLENLPKIYALETVNSNQYQDLEIRFDLPDDFDISGSPAIDLTNPNPSLNVPGFGGDMTTHDLCVGSYNQNYEVGYPVVISVYDDLTGNYFRFASLVHLGTEKVEIDAEAIHKNITGAYDQSLAESGFTRENFRQNLEAEGMPNNKMDDALGEYDNSVEGERGTLGSALNAITQVTDEQVVMVPGGCNFNI